MTMAGKAFVDTNILLRAFLTDMRLHLEADKLIKEMLRDNTALWISGQVIREFIVQATHPKTLKTPLTIDEVIELITKIQLLFHIADETVTVRENLLGLLKEYPTSGKQVHDANIVATMLAFDVDILLTLNIEDFKRFESKITLVSLD